MKMAMFTSGTPRGAGMESCARVGRDYSGVVAWLIDVVDARAGAGNRIEGGRGLRNRGAGDRSERGPRCDAGGGRSRI